MACLPSLSYGGTLVISSANHVLPSSTLKNAFALPSEGALPPRICRKTKIAQRRTKTPAAPRPSRGELEIVLRRCISGVFVLMGESPHSRAAELALAAQ